MDSISFSFSELPLLTAGKQIRGVTKFWLFLVRAMVRDAVLLHILMVCLNFLVTLILSSATMVHYGLANAPQSTKAVIIGHHGDRLLALGTLLGHI